MLTDLPPNAKAVFERTRKTLGSGTTAIVGRACSACHRDIPYETINRVTAAELHTCAYCKRILVAPDA